MFSSSQIDQILFFQDFTWEGWEEKDLTSSVMRDCMNDKKVFAGIMEILQRDFREYNIKITVETEIVSVSPKIRTEEVYTIEVNGIEVASGPHAAMCLTAILIDRRVPDSFIKDYNVQLGRDRDPYDFRPRFG